jgi:hypothetical protein
MDPYSQYVTKCTKYVAYLLIIFGCLTAFSPDILIENKITNLTFDHLPRFTFGMMQITVGLAMMVPSARFRLTRNVLGGLLFLGWAIIIALPLKDGEPTNGVVIAHFLFWAWRVVVDTKSSLYRRNREINEVLKYSEEH